LLKARNLIVKGFAVNEKMFSTIALSPARIEDCFSRLPPLPKAGED
jgi:hypothetical protein